MGAAAAVVVIVAGGWGGTPHAQPLRLPALALQDNKQHLRSGQVTAFLHFARRYRACARRHGLSLDPPEVGRDEVLISGRGGRPITLRHFLHTAACTLALGNPPPFSAFVLAKDDKHLHLYLPRTCRLPVHQVEQ